MVSKSQKQSKGELVQLKRQPVKPRIAHLVSTEDNIPQTLVPVTCCLWTFI